MKMRRMIGALVAVCIGSAVVAQIPSEQATETLKARAARRLAASTQPANREDLDDVWTEVRRLRIDVNTLREQLEDLRRWQALTQQPTQKGQAPQRNGRNTPPRNVQPDDGSAN